MYDIYNNNYLQSFKIYFLETLTRDKVSKEMMKNKRGPLISICF